MKPAQRSISLAWLLDGIAAVTVGDAQVNDLCLDTRSVRDGSLFFALRGTRAHGLDFAAEAVRRGARVILWEPDAGVAAPDFNAADVHCVPIPGLSSLIGRIADRFFDWPSSNMRVTGITGTNGKTTSAYLLASCLDRLCGSAAYIGTLGLGRIDDLHAATHTTPDAISLQREFARFRAAGVRCVAMEVSSHALQQQRVAGVHFHAAAFTNLSRDHLDYHATMEAYGAAKALLFTRNPVDHMVINAGDAFGRELVRSLAGRADVTAVWVGANESGWLAPKTLFAAAVRSDSTGLAIDVEGSFGSGTLRTGLIGRFNAENMLIVMGLLLTHGVSFEDAIEALARCHAPPGRMQAVQGGADAPLAVIDYAHTPDALAKVLAAAREHCAGLVWCVFGCGGDRDAGKRPLMGAVADELADRVILTDDNPRTEKPADITSAIAAAIRRREFRIINDRREAIRTALSEAAAADLVVIAGKGHEEYQIYGDERLPFSDKLEVERHFGIAA